MRGRYVEELGELRDKRSHGRLCDGDEAEMAALSNASRDEAQVA